MMKVFNLRSELLNRIADSDLLIYLILSLLVLISYSNIIFTTATVSPDAPYILLSLEEVGSLTEYLHKLVTLQGIDFQPLRDLSLFIDLYIFRQTGLNLFIFINCLMWAGCCFHIFKLSQYNSTKNREGFNLILVLCLCVHPIFSQTINWSMGRKHLLAIFFILWATRKFLELIENRSQGKWMGTLYGLSLLSVPVSLLWPVWAGLLVLFTLPREKFKSILVRLLPLCVLMILAGVINYAFYFTSTTYKEIYIQKSGSIQFSLILNHIGLHVKQILYPFALRFNYMPDDSTLWFFGALIIAVIALFIKRKNETTIWFWLSFAMISMLLFLRTPETYFDTYVILPAVGFFLLLIRILKPTKVQYAIASVSIPVLLGITLSSNPTWKSLRTFGENNFRYNQDCPTARALAGSFYAEKKKLPVDLYEFIQRNNCLEPLPGESPVGFRGIRNLESRMLLIEDEIDLEYRKQRLQQMGEENYYPKIIYGLLQAKSDATNELENTMEELNQALGTHVTSLDYDPVVTDELKSFCEREVLTECMKFTKRYGSKISQPFL